MFSSRSKSASNSQEESPTDEEDEHRRRHHHRHHHKKKSSKSQPMGTSLDDARSCSICEKAQKPGQSFYVIGASKNSEGRPVCDKCFKCDHCGKDLAGAKAGAFHTNPDTGKLYCDHDYKKHFAPKCHGCKKINKGGEDFLTVNGPAPTGSGKQNKEPSYLFHPRCFCCAECNQEITGSYHGHEEEGGKHGKKVVNFYCSDDYDALFGDICARKGCGQPIRGGEAFFEVLGKKYHAENPVKGKGGDAGCFACTKCAKPLLGGKYRAIDNEPLCEDCYTDHRAPKCGECSKPMKKWVQVQDKMLCQSCMRSGGTCFSCKTLVLKPKAAAAAKDAEDDRRRNHVVNGLLEDLGDGRQICERCSVSAVRTQAEAFDLLDEVKVVLAANGLVSFGGHFGDDNGLSGNREHDGSHNDEQLAHVMDNLTVALVTREELASQVKGFCKGKSPLGVTLCKTESSVKKSRQKSIAAAPEEEDEKGKHHKHKHKHKLKTITTTTTALMGLAQGAAAAGGGGGAEEEEEEDDRLRMRQKAAKEGSVSGPAGVTITRTEVEQKDHHHRHRASTIITTTTVTQTTLVVTGIEVLECLPRTQLGAVMAHELGHSFMTLKGFGGGAAAQAETGHTVKDIDPIVEEGLCEVFAYLWLKSVAEEDEQKASEKKKKALAAGTRGSDGNLFLDLQKTNEDPVYGGGFRECLRAFQSPSVKENLPLLMSLVKENRKLPAVK